MAGRRTYGSYNDGCATAHALDLIGERWMMIVARELLLGPKRFVDLQRDVIGIGPTVLTQRLADLVDHGLAHRRRVGDVSRAEVYELTAWGHRLEQVNTALALWAVESPALPREADMSPDTLVLTMRAHARARHDLRAPVVVALLLTDSRRTPPPEPVSYVARMSAEGTTLTREPVPSNAAATLSASTRSLKSAVLGAPEDLTAADDVEICGDEREVAHLVASTRLAPPDSGTP